jgi:hypothetical protein
MSKTMARFTAFAWALLAVSLLVFQPICEAAESHSSDGHGGSCCVIMEAAPVPMPATATGAPPSAVGLSAVDFPAFRSLKLSYASPANVSPVSVAPYYVRSARIQR